VALAVRKIYPHRIVFNTPETERSVQWGSDPKEVAVYLAGVTPASVIEEVLQNIDVPL